MENYLFYNLKPAFYVFQAHVRSLHWNVGINAVEWQSNFKLGH